MRCKHCGEPLVENNYFSQEEIEILNDAFSCDCVRSKKTDQEHRADLAEKTREYTRSMQDR